MYIYVYTHTQTHTHIYIYMYVYILYTYIKGMYINSIYTHCEDRPGHPEQPVEAAPCADVMCRGCDFSRGGPEPRRVLSHGKVSFGFLTSSAEICESCRCALNPGSGAGKSATSTSSAVLCRAPTQGPPRPRRRAQ